MEEIVFPPHYLGPHPPSKVYIWVQQLSNTKVDNTEKYLRSAKKGYRWILEWLGIYVEKGVTYYCKR